MSANQLTYYISGYNSSGSTTRELQAHIPYLKELRYDVLQPSASLEQMAQQIQHDHNQAKQTHPTVTLIASSLGGWYAERLSANITNTTPNIYLHIVLYNPSINAETNLAKYGLASDVLDEYTTLKTQYQSAFAPHTRTVIVSTDDEVVSPQDNITYYSDRAELIQTMGGHRMTEKNIQLVVERCNSLEKLRNSTSDL